MLFFGYSFQIRQREHSRLSPLMPNWYHQNKRSNIEFSSDSANLHPDHRKQTHRCRLLLTGIHPDCPKLGDSRSINFTCNRPIWSITRHDHSHILLPSALTMSLSVSLVPSLSEAAARKDIKTIHMRLHQSLKLALVTGAPFAVLMFVLAEPFVRICTISLMSVSC